MTQRLRHTVNFLRAHVLDFTEPEKLVSQQPSILSYLGTFTTASLKKENSGNEVLISCWEQISHDLIRQ